MKSPKISGIPDISEELIDEVISNLRITSKDITDEEVDQYISNMMDSFLNDD